MKKIDILFLFLFIIFSFNSRLLATPDKGLQTYTPSEIDTAEINALFKKATEYALMGQLEDALMVTRRVYFYSAKIGYTKGLAMGYTVEGRVLYRKAKYDSSLFILNKGLSIAKDLNDSALQSIAYLNLGNAYSYMGNHTPATEYYFKGLAIEEKLRSKPLLQWYFNNLGVVFTTQKNYPKGLEYFLKSKRISERTENKKSLDMLYNNIGWVYMLLDKRDSSLFFLNQSLDIAKNSKDKYVLTLCLHNLAELYIKLKQYEKAYQYAFDSYEISRKYGYRDQMVQNLQTLGTVRLDQKRYNEAENYLLQGVTLSREIGAKTLTIGVSAVLARLYEAKNNYEKAYDYYVLYSHTNDTVLNQYNSKRITEMNTKYTTEQKEEEIELLKRNKKIQQLELSKNEDSIQHQRTISISIFTGFILLMIAAILLLNQYNLNKKINEQLQKAYLIIGEKNALIEKSNAIITDSIAYAKNLQEAILPKPEDLTKLISEDFFIIHKPSHIVSGDFFWCSSQENKTIIVVADCTGHGVPGAFMSMIGNALLNELINERKLITPQLIAEELDKRIIDVLHQYENSQKYDGMDISICCIDKVNNEITFTGARHSMYVFNGNLKKIKGDPYSIGGAQHQQSKLFTSQSFRYEKGLRLYFMTDGYCDQSGGESNKRFTSGQFENLLTQIQRIDMHDQKGVLEKAFDEWKGNMKQRDDVLVIGLKC